MEHDGFYELISRRCSCRDYDGSPVPREAIDACLEAVRLAPSACNAQPYRVFVCTGGSAAAAAKLMQGAGMNRFTSSVPCFFIFTEDSYNASAAAGRRLKDQDYRSVDIGIAAAQLTLCACSLGLASCIIGWFDEKELQKLLGTQQRIRLAVALGHASGDDAPREKKRKTLDRLVKFLD